VGNISTRISAAPRRSGRFELAHTHDVARTIREKGGIDLEMLELIPPARDLARVLSSGFAPHAQDLRFTMKLSYWWSVSIRGASSRSVYQP
jgi:hypothetical protein